MIQITDLSQIACGDCLEIMQEMTSASVDARTLDFGIYCYGKQDKNMEERKQC